MVSGKPRLENHRPRFFKPCDVARIARNCVSDNNLTEEEVLACVAKGLGFSHISLSRRAPVVAAGVSLSKGQVRTGVNLIKSVLNAIKNRFPSLLGRIGAILEFLDKLERVIDALVNAPDQRRVEDATRPGTCECKDQPIEGQRNGTNDN